MPTWKKANEQAIYKALDRNEGNVAKTARELSLHWNTVNKYKKRRLGLCRCGRPLDDPNYISCARCRAWTREHSRNRRRYLKQKGVCIVCGKPLAKSSYVLCDDCLAKARDRETCYRERLGPEYRRILYVLRHFGPAGLDAYKEASGRCQACNAPEPPHRRHSIHHIDGNDGNNASDNFVILCKTCHAIITRLIEHPDILKLLSYLPDSLRNQVLHFHETMQP